MVNPYAPCSAPGQKTDVQTDAPPRTNLAWLLFFLPGTTVGLHLGAIIEDGVSGAIQRTMGNPLDSLQFFATFGFISFALTLIYRVPRWYFAGPHRVYWWSAFLSGVVIVGLAYSTVVTFEKFNIINPPAPVSATAIALIGFVIFASVAAGVELEAYFARMRNRKQFGEPSNAPESAS